ncbi:MAG: BatA domain-containing protein [Gemmatimonadaceae bacterium]|nr:BatA domain-containing protein [Gemmatimonadaceae bacterium]
MIWQTPWAWLGLASLLLPLLVHLFSRRHTRVLPFPSLRFLEPSRLLPTRQTRLSDVPLLLLRLLLLAVATAALAQPLWSPNARDTGGGVARVLIVDTAVVMDAAAHRALRQDLDRRAEGAQSVLRIPTANPSHALDGAAAWLSAQRGVPEVVVISDFRATALDSLDLAALPRDIRLQLVRVGRRSASAADTAPGLAAPADGVYWSADLPTDMREAVIRAVRARGARVLRSEPVPPSAAAAARVVLVASPASDRLREWTRTAHALRTPWMGRTLLALAGDSMVITAGAALRVPDTVIAAPFVTIVRDAQQAPLVMAAAISDTAAAGAERLMILSRAPATSLASAALLLSASHALAAPQSADANAGMTELDRIASQTPNDARLAAWTRAPAAATIPAAATAVRGASDGRWLWVVVLALLGIEAWLRRRIERRTESRAASRTQHGTA